MLKLAVWSVLLSLSHAALAQSPGVNLKKLCGVSVLKKELSGSFVLESNQGRVSADAPTTEMHLDQLMKLEKSSKLILPKDKNDPSQLDPEFTSTLQQMGITGAQEGMTYELSAVDSQGQPAKLMLSKNGEPHSNNLLFVKVVPYGNKRNFVTFGIAENGFSGPFEIFYGTDDCD